MQPLAWSRSSCVALWGLGTRITNTYTNWRLALAICLYMDWIMSHCSCWPSTPPERSSGWRSGVSMLCPGKTGRTGLQMVRYFQEILWAQFLHRLRSTNGDVCSLWLAVTFTRLAATFCKMCAWFACTSQLQQNHIYADFPPTTLEGYFRALWNASQAIVLFFRPN